MLLAALILVLLGVPLQLTYCVRLILTKGRAEPRWYYAGMAGGVCNVVAGLLLHDPLLITGQAVVLCLYSLTRPKAKYAEPEVKQGEKKKEASERETSCKRQP